VPLFPISAAINKLGTQPETTGEKYVNAGISGLSGGLASAGPSLLRAGATGALSGLGSEAGQQLAGDANPKAQLAASLLGGIAGGTLGGVAGALRTTRPALIREATRDTSSAALQDAQRRMEEAATGGIPINASQAMTEPSGIDKLVSMLANSKNGPEVQKQLRAQPGQVSMAAEDAVGALPGTAQTPHDAANAVQARATNVITNAQDARTQLWQKTLNDATKARLDALTADRDAAKNALAAIDAKNVGFVSKGPIRAAAAQAVADAEVALKNANVVPAGAVSAEIRRLQAEAAARPNATDGQLLGQLSNRLIGKDGKPLTNPTQINGALKSFADTLNDVNLATPGTTKGVSKFLQSQIEQVRQNLGESFDPLRQANKAYAANTESVMNPLTQSVVGRMSGVRGYDPAKEAAVTKLPALFDAGTVPNAPSDILDLEKRLRGVAGGPEAFQDAFKTWATKKLSGVQSSADNRAPEDVAAALTRVFGDPTKATVQSQGTKDMLVALARSQKLPPADQTALVNGFQQFQRITAAAARRPGTVGDSTRDLAAASSGINSTKINPFTKGLEIVANLRGGDALRFADKLVTTPEGMATLIKLAKQPMMSQAAANTIATFAATLSAQQSAAPQQ
jgi:hypothetical protein